jgi:hypothetical protein
VVIRGHLRSSPARGRDVIEFDQLSDRYLTSRKLKLFAENRND